MKKRKPSAVDLITEVGCTRAGYTELLTLTRMVHHDMGEIKSLVDRNLQRVLPVAPKKPKRIGKKGLAGVYTRLISKYMQEDIEWVEDFNAEACAKFIVKNKY